MVPLLVENIRLQFAGGADVVMLFDTAAGELSADEFAAHFRILNVGEGQPEVLGVQFSPSRTEASAGQGESVYRQPVNPLAVPSPAFDLPPDDDVEWRAVLLASRDSGLPDLMPPRTLAGGGVGLALTAPVYRAGAVPAQVDARVPHRGGAGGYDVRDRLAVGEHAQAGLHAHVLRAVEEICVVKCVFHAAHLFLQPGRAGQAGQNE